MLVSTAQSDQTLTSPNVELRVAIKSGIAVGIILCISALFQLPWAWTGVFVCYYLMTRYRSHSLRTLVQRVAVYTLTAVLFLLAIRVCAGNRFLLVTAILVVSAPCFYVAACGKLPMPVIFGGPIICIPMIMAWSDPYGAEVFTVTYFRQYLLALCVAFVVTQFGGADLSRDRLWGLFPKERTLRPLRRNQMIYATRPLIATALGTLVVVLVDPPGSIQIIITAIVMTMQQSVDSAKAQVQRRLLGCFSGALLGFACGIVLTYVPSFLLLVLVVVGVYMVLSYYYVQESESWYVWQQVGVAFAMVVVTDGPVLTHELVIERFEGIIVGAIVGSLSYLVPLPPIREEEDLKPAPEEC